MSETGAARAWQFLKRNPDYLAKWRNTADAAPAITAAPFPLRAQTPADLKAAAWGVLAWENPLAANGPVSPFWAEAPMLEAEAVPPDAALPVPPLMALLRQCGARMSGLRLWPGGALILKIERDDAAMQIRLAGGGAFDADAGIVLRLPFGLGLPERLTRARDLWAIAASGSKKAAAGGSATASC